MKKVFRKRNKRNTKFKMASEIMGKAAKELRSRNARLAQRAKIIEAAKADVFEVISFRGRIRI